MSLLRLPLLLCYSNNIWNYYINIIYKVKHVTLTLLLKLKTSLFQGNKLSDCSLLFKGTNECGLLYLSWKYITISWRCLVMSSNIFIATVLFWELHFKSIFYSKTLKVKSSDILTKVPINNFKSLNLQAMFISKVGTLAPIPWLFKSCTLHYILDPVGISCSYSVSSIYERCVWTGHCTTCKWILKFCQ